MDTVLNEVECRAALSLSQGPDKDRASQTHNRLIGDFLPTISRLVIYI